MALFVTVAALHCSVLSGLIPWLSASTAYPFTSTLLGGDSGGARPGEVKFPRSDGVVRRSRTRWKGAWKTPLREMPQQRETLGTVLPRFLAVRMAPLPPEPPPPLEGRSFFGGDAAPDWAKIVRVLRTSKRRWLVVEVRNGLGNRLRALASAMAVARAEQRPLLALWKPDLHCNCSLRTLLAPPLPFVLVEAPPYTRHALAMHWSCTGHALVMHWSCTGHAHTEHTPCISRAHAVHTPCTRHAHAVHALSLAFARRCRRRVSQGSRGSP